MSFEVIESTTALTNLEQTVATLTAYHPFVSLYVNAAGAPAANNSIWRLYAVSDGASVLLQQGRLTTQGVPTALLLGVDTRGAVVKLTVQGTNAPAAASVVSELVGYDPGDVLTPATEFTNANITLSYAEQDVCTLGANYPLLNVSVNPNNDPLALGSLWRLYAVFGATRYLISEQRVTDVKTQALLMTNVAASGTTYVLTATGVLGVSAVNVTGVVFGSNPVTQSGGGGGGGGAFWPYNAQIPATVVAPELEQAPQTDPNGAGANITLRAQSAGNGGGNTNAGGTFQMIMGKDGTAYPSDDQALVVYKENVIGGTAYPNIKGLFDVYFLPGGQVAGIGGALGDDGLGLNMAGWQIASSKEISVASHTFINVSTIQGANIAQLAVQNVDSSFGSFNGAGLQFQYATEVSGATDDSGFQLQRNSASVVGTGVTRYIDIEDGIPVTNPSTTRRWSVDKVGSYANIVFQETTGVQTDTAAAGLIRLPHGSDSGIFPFMATVLTGGGGDSIILSRVGGRLSFGGVAEDNNFISLANTNFEFFNASGKWSFTSPIGQQFAIYGGGQTIVHGQADVGGQTNGTIYDLFDAITNVTTANEVIASIPIQDGINPNVVTQLHVTIVGRDDTNSDFATYEIVTAVTRTGTTITFAATGGTPATNTGSSAGAGVAVNPNLVSGAAPGTIDVRVTPWTTDLVGWSVQVKQAVCKTKT